MLKRLLLVLLVLAAVSGCKNEPPYRTYENTQAGLRFNPARDWLVEEKAEPGCLFAVEASKGPDLRFVVCASQPRPEILFTQNTFVACENLKEYVANELKGQKPVCMRGGTGGLFGYDTVYARLVKTPQGKVRVQFVNHLFIPDKGRLIQLMSIAVADDDKAAKALFEENRAALFAMMGSVRKM